MVKGFIWTSEMLSNLAPGKLDNVRENAADWGDAALLALCDAEIARRKPLKKTSAIGKNGRAVKGYHLVCRSENGVVHNDDGTFRSGSWVIAKNQVERSEAINAYVALHEKQSDESYLQGIIKGWRIVPRERRYADQERETKEGIEFLLEPFSEALPWRGDGTIEKSYWYGDDGDAASRE
ncbi:hypothetical protein ACWAUC_29295 [Bradyrhizobium guangdongense]